VHRDFLITLYYSGDEIHEHEVGGECSRDGGRGEIHAVFFVFVWGGRDLKKLDEL
jgi:hypothetical protein